MLLTYAKFAEFTSKQIADAREVTEVLTCIAVDSRDRVDAIVEKAVRAGGSEPRDPQDHGFMVQRSFEDLDGHIWEVVWMDPATVQEQ
jgi:predicted lactoylglutathione lyase